jgi:hypothetical protein
MRVLRSAAPPSSNLPPRLGAWSRIAVAMLLLTWSALVAAAIAHRLDRLTFRCPVAPRSHPPAADR